MKTLRLLMVTILAVVMSGGAFAAQKGYQEDIKSLLESQGSDIKGEIILKIAQGPDFIEALESIDSLRGTSRILKNYIEKNREKIIEELAKRFKNKEEADEWLNILIEDDSITNEELNKKLTLLAFAVLKKAGANLSGALSNAVKVGRSIEVVKTLIDKGGAEVNKQGGLFRGRFQCYTALIWATQNGDIDMINFLLEEGANPNEKDVLGETALYHAERALRDTEEKGYTRIMHAQKIVKILEEAMKKKHEGSKNEN